MLLSIRTTMPVNIGGRVWFTCPMCGTGAVYFSKPPDFCEECMTALPNLKSLANFVKARQQYHDGDYLETWAEEYDDKDKTG